ncbi:Caffeic acid 3-O-methyltransferase [Bienertia sinuspersici]
MNNITTKNGCITPLDKEDEEEENYGYAWQIVESMALPMVMYAIIELDVLGTIARTSPGCNLLASEIVARLPEVRNPMAASMLDRMLWLLATHNIVTCSIVESKDGDIKRKYGLSPVAKYFVPNEDGVSMAPLMSLNQDKVFVDSWSKLKEAVLEGGVPFNMVHGMHAFEYPNVDPRFNEVLNKAMAQSLTFVKKIFDKYKGLENSNVKQLVDVGGGLGHSVGFITSQYPSIKGINFDLPHVIKDAPPTLGVKHVGGDMFESVPKGDAIFLKWILHDWSDEHCLTLLKNCYKALPEDGKIIVVEGLVNDEPQMTTFARAISQVDVLMMTQTPGGKERSKREFEALAKGAGFSGIDFTCCVHRFWVMEFYK